MSGLNVKNTMVERVMQVVAPHPCSGCGKMGAVLCDDCKYDIVCEPFLGCILCGRPQSGGICKEHDSPIERAFTVSQRSGVLEDVINALKFKHVKAAAVPLADLLHDSLPVLPDDIVIIPIPTVRSHVRQRGYDQVELIVRQLASLRSLAIVRALKRVSKTTQHTVGKDERKAQAAAAFALYDGIDLSDKTVLLVDDIVTTSSTLAAAAQLLASVGAKVWVATIAYQPLD